jgi:hypothetical protein
LAVIAQAIVSLTKRFEQYQGYEKSFGFLFTSALDDNNLRDACTNLENALKSGEQKDIDGHELFLELIVIQELLKESMGPLDILKCLKKHPFYPNASIA